MATRRVTTGTKKTSAPKRVRAAVALDQDEIGRRAFMRFIARGRTHGHDLDDWLAAEAELAASR